MKSIKKDKKDFIILFLLIFTYVVLFSFMSVLKHHNFTSLMDLAMNEREIRHLSKGEFSYTNQITKTRLFEDHFRPINFLLVPFYWIYPHTETLLILQSFFLGLGALPIYLISRNKLKNNKISLLMAGIYLLYIPLEAISLMDFHFVSFAIPFLLFAFYFLEKNRLNYFALFSLLAIACREEIALIIFMMGIYIAIKKNKKIGILIAMISLLYFVVVVGFLLPFFAKETTTFKSGSDDFLQNRYSYLGHSYKEIFKTLITQPIYVLKHVFTLPKIEYLFLLFFSVGFGIFSIFAPEILMISLPILAINLLSEQPMMYEIIRWYNAGIIPFIFISTIYGIPRFINFFNKKIRSSM